MVACSSFVCVLFSNCLFDLSEQFIFHFISFLILHLKWWAVGFHRIWSNGPRLPSLSTLFFSLLSKWVFFPSVEWVFLLSFLPSLCLEVFAFSLPLEWVQPFLCLAQSLASGCLTREHYPNAEKEMREPNSLLCFVMS